MKRRIAWVALFLVALGLPAAWYELVYVSGLDRQYQEQLRLARKEGLPTTPAEFEAGLQPVPIKDNAAPIYERLAPYRDLQASQSAAVFGSFGGPETPEQLASWRRYVERMQPVYAVAEEAVTRSGCRFHRDWSKGILLGSREAVDIKNAARAMLVRAALAAAEGRHEAALADAQRTLAMARHLSQDPLAIGRIIGTSVSTMAMDELARCAVTHPEFAGYRKLFAEALGDLPEVDLRAEHRYDLVEILSAVELSQTPEGRRKIGIHEEDLGAAETVQPMIRSPQMGRIDIVKAAREYWAAIGGPDKDMAARILKARARLANGFGAFPAASGAWLLSSGAGNAYDRLCAARARRLVYRAFLRATESGKPAAQIRTDDLRSPWTGAPLGYVCDGIKMAITVDTGPAGATPVNLIVPMRRAGRL